eukprot:m.75306 g.75306  ORF g.75306 m.75306 type:complete len:982 (+) comp35937_c0_seq4:2015-4960(+)
MILSNALVQKTCATYGSTSSVIENICTDLGCIYPRTMPRKLPFRVIYWSGADEDYPARDLEVHSPLVKGWRSSRYCIYPQEIVFQLAEGVRLRKIQLLAHQYLIATKIELCIGNVPTGLPCSLQNCQFQRLGYISLSDNQATGFKAREMKSVHIDAVGQFVKLLLHKNHINRHNLYSQVGLVAVNVIADDPSKESADLPFHFTHRPAEESLTNILHSYLPSPGNDHPVNPDPLLWGKVNRADVSPMDDLIFDMYIDPETAQLMRRLELKKTEAVQEERYDYAKKLKQAIADLRKVGERLARYEVEKQKAVEKEDYDTAQVKKIQGDEFRLNVYQQLDLNDLLELDNQKCGHRSRQSMLRSPLMRSPALGRKPLQKVSSPIMQRLSPLPVHLLEGDGDQYLAYEDRHHLQPVQASPAPPERENQMPIMESAKLDAYDERPLPALSKRTHSQSNLADETLEGDSPRKNVGAAESLTDNASREASVAIDVFGMEIVKNLYSKVFSHREEGLNGVQAYLLHQESDSVDRSDTVKATLLILRRALTDNIHPVWQRGLEVLRALLTTFAKKYKVGKESIGSIVDKTLPLVLAKGVETAPRTREMAKKFVQDMAQFPLVKPLSVVGPHSVEPVKPQSPWRLFATRIELVELLIKDLGINNKSGLSVGSIMKFIRPGLEHTRQEVRDLSLRLVLDLYKTEEYKAAVKSHLPEFTDELKKKTLWRTLFKEFDKMDGKETEEDKQAALRAEERKKKAEVDALKAQLATLKDIASGKVPTGDVDFSALGIQADESPKRGRGPKSIKAQAERKRKESHMSVVEGPSSEKECVFCGEKNDAFDEAGLERHFLADCPMLQRCLHCNQVVEVAVLRDHWVSECEENENFKPCETCNRAILLPEYEQHVSDKNCEAPANGSVCCPLCHETLTATDKGWRSHLLSCKKNPRKRKIPAPQAGGKRIPGKTGIPMRSRPTPVKKTDQGTKGSKLPQFKRK